MQVHRSPHSPLSHTTNKWQHLVRSLWLVPEPRRTTSLQTQTLNFFCALICSFLLQKKKKEEEQKQLLEKEKVQDVVILTEIGRGSFGTVFKGLCDGVPVALKRLKEQSRMESFLRELSTLRSINHPNIIRYFGVHSHKKSLYLVMEFMEFGSLHRYAKKEKKNLKKRDLLLMVRQIILGMKHLQFKRIIHRDLALRNILVGQQVCNKEIGYVIKIADFGMSIPQSVYKNASASVPIRWSPPEALKFRHFSHKTDVWAFGVVLHELFSYGQTPYEDLSNKQVVNKVLQGYRMPPPQDCPPFLYNLMLDCWNSNPEKRPDFGEILQSFEKEFSSDLPNPPPPSSSLEPFIENSSEGLYLSGL